MLILTGDRDMFQLISERVQILYTPGGPNPTTTVYGLPELHDRYELTPQQFIDLKALTGDSSDNIPGVPGVGEKTAVKFLKEYGSLDNLYDHVDEISGPKTRQNLIDAKPQVALNKTLVTIVRDLDLTYDPEECRLHNYDQETVVELFNELEFRSLLKELPQSALPGTDENGQMGLFDSPSAESAAPPAGGVLPPLRRRRRCLRAVHDR